MSAQLTPAEGAEYTWLVQMGERGHLGDDEVRRLHQLATTHALANPSDADALGWCDIVDDLFAERFPDSAEISGTAAPLSFSPTQPQPVAPLGSLKSRGEPPPPTSADRFRVLYESDAPAHVFMSELGMTAAQVEDMARRHGLRRPPRSESEGRRPLDKWLVILATVVLGTLVTREEWEWLLADDGSYPVGALAIDLAIGYGYAAVLGLIGAAAVRALERRSHRTRVSPSAAQSQARPLGGPAPSAVPPPFSSPPRGSGDDLTMAEDAESTTRLSAGWQAALIVVLLVVALLAAIGVSARSGPSDGAELAEEVGGAFEGIQLLAQQWNDNQIDWVDGLSDPTVDNNEFLGIQQDVRVRQSKVVAEMYLLVEQIEGAEAKRLMSPFPDHYRERAAALDAVFAVSITGSDQEFERAMTVYQATTSEALGLIQDLLTDPVVVAAAEEDGAGEELRDGLEAIRQTFGS